MPVFTVTGDVDPFLHVSLEKGEAIFCESDAMVMMEANLDLSGTVQGGILQAAMRRFANGESFFQQRIEAARGAGDCLLSPTMPGGVEEVPLLAGLMASGDEEIAAGARAALATVDRKGVDEAIAAALPGAPPAVRAEACVKAAALAAAAGVVETVLNEEESA